MEQLCFTCGKPEAPARCSRCLAAWFCDADCQRVGWKVHKPNCRSLAAWVPLREGPPVARPSVQSRDQLKWATGKDAERLFRVAPCAETDVMESVQRNLQNQQPLDALGAALRWQVTATNGDQQKSGQVVDALWNRCGWEPLPYEKHDYSLLHRDPPSKTPTVPEAQPMIPVTVKDGETVDGTYQNVSRRYPAALVGARCPVVDAEGSLSEATINRLRPYMDARNPRPCIIRNLPLFQRAVDKWDVEYLAQHMGDQLYHTFAADQDVRRFAYFFDTRNEGGYESPPIAEAHKMTFSEFVSKQRNTNAGKCYYLQTPVLQYADGVITSAKFDAHMDDDLHAINQDIMKRLADLGSFGPISRNQLFVSFSDFCTAAHYDQQHNLFLQVRGAKRFLLFDAADMPALYSYPAHHPLDRKAMIDLEHPDLDSFPRGRALAFRGVEALLEQGDILFMPMSWFHFVHSLGPEVVSLNFWFYDSGVLFLPSKVLWPLSPPSIIELSRHIEYFAAEQLGPANVGSFMKWWLGSAPAPADKLLANRWRFIRNYILRRLTLHPAPVAARALAMLDPRRWDGLKLRAGEPAKAIEGLREEHRVEELLDGLTELRLSMFRDTMPGAVYRVLGRALDVIPREKLRFYLESSEEALCLVRDHTDWKGKNGTAPVRLNDKHLFGSEEARKMPNLILRSLEELSGLAVASNVKIVPVDNGFFANWLQVLDAAFFAPDAASLEPDWVLTGLEREFNYGGKGDDVFHGLFEPLPKLQVEDSNATTAESTNQFVVHHRFNLLLVNVFRGFFLRGPKARSRRRLYARAANKVFSPGADALRARDDALASVPRAPDQCLIGVHKRVDNPGTARMQFEQIMASTDAYIEAVRKLAVRRGISEDNFIVLLATDDEMAEDRFKRAFEGRLICRSVRRSVGGVNDQNMPLEVHGQAERLRIVDARDCLVDALLLAACDAFVHADSNVTIAAGIMNPESEAVHVRELVPDAESGREWPGYRRCKLPT